MTNIELLSRLGLYVDRRFLPQELCGELREHLAQAPRTHAAEVYANGELRVNREIRRTQEVEGTPALRAAVQARLDGVTSALAAHFSVPLRAPEDVTFLVYETGGFYRPHRDRAMRDAAAGGNETNRRRVSAVIFLNQAAQSPTSLEYAGGRLTLYGLLDDERLREVGFPVEAEPGSLVAFDSSTLHEVTPVTAGTRMTAVGWFY